MYVCMYVQTVVVVAQSVATYLRVYSFARGSERRADHAERDAEEQQPSSKQEPAYKL